MTYYVDFDGVILDTMPIYWRIFEEHNLEKFVDIYDFFSWDTFLVNDIEINNSLSILRELQDKHNIILLSKVNGKAEEEAKDQFLKKNGINIKTIYVNYFDKKTDKVKVDENTILIDDDDKNIKEWIACGGKGYLFTNETIDGYDCINSLKVIGE